VPAAEDAGEDYSAFWWADDAVSDTDPVPFTQAVPEVADLSPFGEQALGAGGEPPWGSNEAPWGRAPKPAASGQPGAFATRPASSADSDADPFGASADPWETPARPAKHARADDGTPSRVRGRRWATGITVLSVVVLAILGVATAQIVSRLNSHAGTAVPSATPTAQPAVAAGLASASARSSSSASATPGTTSPSGAATPTASAQPLAASPLAVAQASAFGPNGTSDGDHPASAGSVIMANAPVPWRTYWYATADFGMLKQGTGLLLDMGKTVTVTSVRIQLGASQGANLQVRAGDTASLSGAPVVASANDTGGTLTVNLSSPAQARYIIIWFTQLPPNGAGQYQETVYNVAVTGQP
jgi:hypothetical protein